MMVNLPCLKGSCPNFLRPTCSYTECWLSFLTGSCPTERTTAGYSSCLYLFYRPLCFIWYGYSVDALPGFPQLVFVLMQYLLYSIVIGFLSRTLLDFRSLWNPARVWIYYAIYLLFLCCQCFLLVWVFYVH